MAGLLQFNQYIGGADNVKLEQVFPSTQKTVAYNFGQDITGWSFSMDYQTIVIDSMSYDRVTGDPNFANSSVIGSFPSGVVSTATYIAVTNTSSGVVSVTFPGGLYDGPVLPDARTHIPITIVGFTWQDASNPPQINTNRWAFLQCYEPGVVPADPVNDPAYTPISEA